MNNSKQKAQQILEKEDFYEIVQQVFSKLENEKAENIILYEFTEKNTMFYYGIIASAGSARHLSALSDKIVEDIKNSHRIDIKIDGASSGQWLVIDLSGIIIHIFQPIYRKIYDIELLWRELGFINAKLREEINKMNLQFTEEDIERAQLSIIGIEEE